MFRVLLLLALINTIICSLGSETLSKKAQGVKLFPNEVMRVEQLHYGWYIQAVSSLLGAMGKELYINMDRKNRRAFIGYLDSIKDEYDIKKGAQCLVKAFDGKLMTSSPKAVNSRTTKKKFPKRMDFNKLQYHSKRIRRNTLSLYTNEEVRTDAKLDDSFDSPWKVKTLSRAPALKDTSSLQGSTVTKITDLLGGIVRLLKNKTREEQTNLHDSYRKVQQLEDLVSKRSTEETFKYRMLDMVLGKKSPYRRRKTIQDQFLLSPSILPFYRDDTGNSILPLPKLLEAIGTEEKEREKILELIMEASGANEIVDDALRISKNLLATDLGKDIFEISSVIEKSYHAVQKSFTSQQRKDMATRKYTFLEKDQLHQLYGENGIYNNTLSQLQFNIDEYSQMSRVEKEESLKETVKILAGQSRRRKRALTVKVLKPTVLAPFGFAPSIEVFNILGPTVLSPNIFSPSILTPLLLSPPVLSPQIGRVLILSPYLLGPNVLSGSIFDPYILSPYVLSPNVLNPYVMSPLILSPLVLCPALSSPTLMSGSILSPSVASPAVLTESALAIAVLSPSVLQ